MARSKRINNNPTASLTNKPTKRGEEKRKLKDVREAKENESFEEDIEEILKEIEEERNTTTTTGIRESEANAIEEEEAVLNETDVENEVRFWSTAVVVYVLGANPPNSVLSGYIRRVWKANGIANIAASTRGPCLVRFKSKEQQQEVLRNGHLMFDNKPVIVRE